jgi:hypothetical protein
MANDNVQHGIDDDPNNDAEKGAALGGLGGAAVGAAAGAMAGPVGAVVGAVVGGLSGAGASGLAVGAVDRVDNDNTVSGLGSSDANAAPHNATLSGANVVGMAEPTRTDMADSGVTANRGTIGSPSTGVGDVSDMNSDRGITGAGTMGVPNVAGDITPGNNIPGVQTGGATTAGADTRGITEKAADAVTGDRMDDKTGGVVTQSATGSAVQSASNVASNVGASASSALHGAGQTVENAADNVGGHNIVTGDQATSDAGKAGLGTGAIVGGVIGTAVGGPVGAVVGGAIGSLAGGVTGDAAEAAEQGDATTSAHDANRRL